MILFRLTARRSVTVGAVSRGGHAKVGRPRGPDRYDQSYREAGVSQHQGVPSEDPHPKTRSTSRHNSTEGFQAGPGLGPHYAERAEPLGR